MENYISILADLLGESYNGTGLETRLSKFYIYNGGKLFKKLDFERKSDCIKRNIRQFDEADSFKLLIYLFENRMYQTEYDEMEELINKMKSDYPDYLEAGDSILNIELVEEVKHWLDDYPDAKREYETAYDQYLEEGYERNILDNLRLSLELLIKDLTGVDRSIENQDIGSILGKLKTVETTNELRNMIRLLIDYYTKYQNELVKHNSSVSESEVEIIFELTSSIMKFLIRELA